MTFLGETADKFGTLRDLVEFLWQQKMWWLIPFVVILVTFGILIVVGSTTGVGPFVYTLF